MWFYTTFVGMNWEAQWQYLQKSPSPWTGHACRLAIFDKAHRDQVRRLDLHQVPVEEHARRISGFLYDEEMKGFVCGSQFFSVSYEDCFKKDTTM